MADEMRKAFNDFDLDGSGKVDSKELEAILKACKVENVTAEVR